MPGSATFDPHEIPLARDAAIITVARWNGLRAVYLPNVSCESVQVRGGAEPRAARFRYVLDDTGFLPDAPTRFDKLVPGSASGPALVRNDDELIVFREIGDDKREVLFWGFAKVPQADVSGDGQAVTFQGVGAEVRAWDTPISFARFRDGDDPEAGDVLDIERPARFNPDGKPNCTPDDFDVAADGVSGLRADYPVFLDERLAGDPAPQSYWTLGKAVRYLLRHNDEKYVRNPDSTSVDYNLQSLEPKEDGGAIDVADDATFDASDIVIREYDATGKPWPVAIEELVSAYGFRLDFILSPTFEGGKPLIEVDFSRLDGLLGDAPRPLRMQEPGSILDPGKTNVGALSITRDNSAVANRIEVETRATDYELSIVLAPGFSPVAGDASSREQFKKSKLTDSTRNKYRLYILDECGSGHWDTRAGSWVTTHGTFGDAVEKDEDGERRWVRRPRPALGALLSKDTDGRRRPYELHVSTDYAGDVAKPWDGTGTWQRVTSGFRMLSDRMGIYFEVDDPEDIRTGASGAVAKGGTLRGISASAIPDDVAYKKFYLRLTCAVSGDDQIEATADRRAATASRFDITRRIDAGDHFRREGVVKPSPYYPAAGTDPVEWVRDDTAKAVAYARAIQSANEAAKFAGRVEIPRFTSAYVIGDRINKIDGINMSMRMNSGGDEEGPKYPTVVGLDWTFGARQSTSLLLADRRAEPYRLF